VRQPLIVDKYITPKCRPEDVLIVINPSLWYQNMYPTGILCLSSYLSMHGYLNCLIDSKLHPQRIPFPARLQLVIERILSLKPRIVCFSSTHKEFDEVVHINSAIRRANPDIITIVGGAQPSYRMSDFITHGFDFVAIGEGEKTLLEFIRSALETPGEWADIDGLVWMRDGVPVVNRRRTFMSSEELGFPVISAYQQLDDKYFEMGVEIIRGLPLIGGLLLTTRGCPFECSFCGCASIFGHKLRKRPLDTLDAELCYLKHSRGVEGVWIVDDTFTIDAKHAIGVAKLLKKYGLIWGCQSRVDTLKEPLIVEMKAAGCVQIDFGVESGSQRILNDVIFKKTTINQIKETFQLTKKYKIRTLANFMIGLPSETGSDLAATKELARHIKADITVFSIATPLPGTKMYDMVGVDISPEDYAKMNWNGSDLTDKLNKSEIDDVVRQRFQLKRKYMFISLLRFVFSPVNLNFFFFRGQHLKRAFTAIRSFWRTFVKG